MLNSTEHDISTAHKTKILTNKFLALSLSDVVLIFGILKFMSRIKVLSSDEYEKKIIT